MCYSLSSHASHRQMKIIMFAKLHSEDLASLLLVIRNRLG